MFYFLLLSSILFYFFMNSSYFISLYDKLTTLHLMMNECASMRIHKRGERYIFFFWDCIWFPLHKAAVLPEFFTHTLRVCIPSVFLKRTICVSFFKILFKFVINSISLYLLQLLQIVHFHWEHSKNKSDIPPATYIVFKFYYKQTWNG